LLLYTEADLKDRQGNPLLLGMDMYTHLVSLYMVDDLGNRQLLLKDIYTQTHQVLCFLELSLYMVQGLDKRYQIL